MLSVEIMTQEWCLFVLRFYGPVKRGQFTEPHVYWAGLVL